jgi:hypothetical protein
VGSRQPKSLSIEIKKEKVMDLHHHDTEWGLCKDCKWWQIEPDETAAENTLGMCIEEELQPTQLRVSGASGCNRFMHGEPAHEVGSSAAPPIAAPTR